MTPEHREGVVDACERAVERLHAELRTREVSCLLRSGDLLRNVSHIAKLRVVYEIPHEWGGVIWRAVEQGATQLVPDVKSDPDYLAQDETIRAEIATPVRAHDEVVGALNVECPDGLGEREVRIVERHAEGLGAELERLIPAPTRSSSTRT